MARKKSAGTKPVARRRVNLKVTPRDYLEKLSQKELIEFILEMANKHPQIAKQLSARTNFDLGNFTQIAIALRKEIEALEPNGYDDDDFSSYEEYAAKVARIANMAQSRPLKKEEMDRLQQYLACMRMLCDTPYILDQNCRLSPKMEELDSILQEIMEEDGHKIIIFSEWERMLQLVREKAEKKGAGLRMAYRKGATSETPRRNTTP